MPAMFAMLLFLSLLLNATVSHAAVNDVLPGDYYPLQPGQTTLTAYAYDRELRGPYAGGRKTFDGRIDSTVLALRAARFFRIGDTTLTGVDQRNPANNERVMAGMSWFLPHQQQVILRVARDTAIDNGFRTGREILLRY